MNDKYAQFFPTDPPTRAVAKLGVEIPNVLVSMKMTSPLYRIARSMRAGESGTPGCKTGMTHCPRVDIRGCLLGSAKGIRLNVMLRHKTAPARAIRPCDREPSQAASHDPARSSDFGRVAAGHGRLTGQLDHRMRPGRTDGFREGCEFEMQKERDGTVVHHTRCIKIRRELTGDRRRGAALPEISEGAA